jgi:hypothetical protein
MPRDTRYPVSIGGRVPAVSYQRPTRGAIKISGTLAGSKASPATPGLIPRLRMSSSGRMTPSPQFRSCRQILTDHAAANTNVPMVKIRRRPSRSPS